MKTLEELKHTPNLLICEIGADGGMGELWRAGKAYASVIWSNGGGWEHVSVAPYKKSHTPSWDEMCSLKDMFFHDNEVVVQYHPAKSEYVNQMPNCLHLWRPIDQPVPTPPSIMVGVKEGQTKSDVLKAIAELDALALKDTNEHLSVLWREAIAENERLKSSIKAANEYLSEGDFSNGIAIIIRLVKEMEEGTDFEKEFPRKNKEHQV